MTLAYMTTDERTTRLEKSMKLKSDMKQQEPFLQSRKLRIRTILFPILFMGLHWLVMNIAALLYLAVFTVVTMSGHDISLFSFFEDQEFLSQILIEQYPIIAVLYSLVLIPVYLVFLSLSRQRDPRVLLNASLRSQHIWPAIAMMIGAMGLTNLWFALLTYLGDQFEYVNEQLQNYIEQASAFTPSAGYIWLILGIVIFAPIAEELLFRGIIQGELRKAMPEWLAIIIQAVIFALFHMQPVQITYVIVPGLLLGVAYAWSRTIWVPIVMHITFNFLGSVIPSVVGEDEVLSSIVIYSQLAFIFIGILAAVYFYMNRRPAKLVSVSPENG